MGDEEVQETFRNGIFFDLNGNVQRLADSMLAKSPVTEHDNDKANEITAQHPNVHISGHVFLFLFLLNQTSVETTYNNYLREERIVKTWRFEENE